MSDFPSEEAILEPKRIQVFGVLHVVFGGLGLLNIVLGLVIMPLQTMMLSKQVRTSPSEDQRMIAEMQLKIYEKIGELNWINSLMGAVVAALILAAGITLLKRRKIGLKLSNTYAWVSIGAKVVGVVIFFLVVKPMITEAMEEIIPEGSKEGETVLMVFNIIMAVAGVLGPVLAAIYPIITLVMLNKPMVRQHLK